MEFNLIIFTYPNLEDYLIIELELLLPQLKNNSKKIDEGIILVTIKSKVADKKLGKKSEYNKIENNLNIDSNYIEKLSKILDTLVLKSRLIKRIGLLISKFENIEDIKLKNNPLFENINIKNKKLTFEVDIFDHFVYERFSSERIVGHLIEQFFNLKVNLENPDLTFFLHSKKRNYLFLDLINRDLTKRDYKINVNSLTLNSLIPNFCFYLLELHKITKTTKIDKIDKRDNKEIKLNILDPLANLGEIIIEASLFNPRKDMKHKDKHNFTYLKLLSKFNLEKNKIENKVKDRNKYYAVVQNNKNFKKLKENLSYIGTKVNLSLYELDWLDVKFDERSIDYIITQLPFYKLEKKDLELQKLLFYQLDYILKNKACIITLGKIYENIINQYSLKIAKITEIRIGKQTYTIYLIKR